MAVLGIRVSASQVFFWECLLLSKKNPPDSSSTATVSLFLRYVCLSVLDVSSRRQPQQCRRNTVSLTSFFYSHSSHLKWEEEEEDIM